METKYLDELIKISSKQNKAVANLAQVELDAIKKELVRLGKLETPAVKLIKELYG